MRNVYSISLVIMILVGIWQKTEGRCGGGPRTCIQHSDCPPYFACLFGPRSVDKYCRLCTCNLTEQCYVDAELAVKCNCSLTYYWGPTCNCPSCLGSDFCCMLISGKCQEDYLYCSGIYAYGLCSGSATRRCCISQECANVSIVSRGQWGARNPKTVTPINTPVHKFFIHHTATPPCQTQTDCSERVRSIQNYHMDSLGWDDIGYSFLVGEDGNVYEGRGWTAVGAHTLGHNSDSFAASVIGNFTNQLPNTTALTAVKDLIACGVQLGKIHADYKLHGHRDAGNTACPGEALYNEIKTWPHYSQTIS